MKPSRPSKSYAINIAPAVLAYLRGLEDSLKKRIGQKISGLSVDPRPRGSIKLEGEKNLYRVRVGKYRIIYTIDDIEAAVLILRVGHRREIYGRD